MEQGHLRIYIQQIPLSSSLSLVVLNYSDLKHTHTQFPLPFLPSRPPLTVLGFEQGEQEKGLACLHTLLNVQLLNGWLIFAEFMTGFSIPPHPNTMASEPQQLNLVNLRGAETRVPPFPVVSHGWNHGLPGDRRKMHRWCQRPSRRQTRSQSGVAPTGEITRQPEASHS